MQKLKNHKKFYWANTTYPLIISICAFVCFLFMYFIYTIGSINPLHIDALYFIIPCLILGLITFIAGKTKRSYYPTILLTTILIPILLFASFVHLLDLALDPKYSIITNYKKYERVIN